MKRAVIVVAFLSSLVTLLALGGFGLVLALPQDSGERAAGLLLTVVAILAFGATVLLIFAPPRIFARAAGRATAVLAALAAAGPLVVAGGAALLFAGLPLGTATPLLDFTAFAAGGLLILGAVAQVLLGYSRASAPGSGAARELPQALPQQLRDAQLRLRAVLEEAGDPEDEVRVTRVDPVDLPSITPFRPRLSVGAKRSGRD